MSKPAVFLDRDGVLIIDKDFQIDIEKIELFPDTILALKSLDSRYYKVVVSNQSGVARGFFGKDDVEKFNRALASMLAEAEIDIDRWYYCPHGPDDGCECRKPRAGMLLDAARELNIDMKNSWIIGDKSSDIKAGITAGIKTILVKTGYAGSEPGSSTVEPDFEVDNLSRAISLINGSVN